MNSPSFNIAAVERDTGLSKDVLRMWERRYGFPLPERDANGERLYPATQVERLRLIKRLMDQGHRPGRLFALAEDELMLLAPRRPRSGDEGTQPNAQSGLEELLALIKQHDATAYQQALQYRLARQGLQTFVLNTIAPLTRLIPRAGDRSTVRLIYEDGKGVLRGVLAEATALGVETTLLNTKSTHRGNEPVVRAEIRFRGGPGLPHVMAQLQELDGVIEVEQTTRAEIDDL